MMGLVEDSVWDMNLEVFMMGLVEDSVWDMNLEVSMMGLVEDSVLFGIIWTVHCDKFAQ